MTPENAIYPCDPPHISPRSIPEELKRIPCWMGTRLARRPNGKMNKPPIRVRRGMQLIKADKTDPENWAAFEEASDALQRGDVDAIGFIFTKDDPFTVLDLDDALDPTTGEIEPLASEVVSAVDTYFEVSISGRGLHGIGEATKPGKRCRTDNIELYDGHSGARFVVITGNRLGGTPENIKPCQEVVTELYSRVFVGDEKSLRNDNSKRTPHSLDGEELLERARRSRSGSKFRRLFDQGDVSEYPSHSDADFALLNMLIFWTAGNRDAIIELFKRSALYRPPPAKGRNYVETSTDNAIDQYTGPYYQPKVIRESERREDVLTPYLRLLLDPSRWKGQRGASAYKAYCGLILLAADRGIETSANDLHIGADVYTLAERAGVERRTLCRSSLPYLTKERLITWRRGKGTKAGKFVLRKPILVDSPKVTTPSVGSLGESAGTGALGTLAQLIRMRSGRSQFASTARLGMIAMFSLVILTTTRREQSVDDLVRLLDRQKSHLWRALHRLVDARIVVSPRHGVFALAPDCWQAFERELWESGTVVSEHLQRERHAKHRKARAEDLRKRQKGEPVTDLHPSAKPRKKSKASKEGGAKVVRIAARYKHKNYEPTDAEEQKQETLRGREYWKTMEEKIEERGRELDRMFAEQEGRERKLWEQRMQERSV